MSNDWVYDIETYANVFTFTAEHADAPIRVCYEISDRKNESRDILDFCQQLKNTGASMVGFNNLGFDYPVLHTLLRMGQATAPTLYLKAQAIFDSQETEDRWVHQVKPTDRLVGQVDLFKVHHFDNKARATGLKALEFAMRSENISDLPFPPGSFLNGEQIEVLKKYNGHDVAETKKFYHKSLDMLRFREQLEAKYPDKDWINFNDTKIGKEYFIMKLEQSGIPCYDYSPEKGRTPRQTKRPVIHLRDAILPWISFEQPEFQRVLDWLKQQSITETKGVFKDLTATIDGFDFVFGLGGIHGSIENKIIEASDTLIIESVDVSSMYPNISIKNRFYPEHLGERFCDIYESLYEERKKYPKGSAENAMLKLSLNGTYGDSNNPHSPFYDPLMTLRITLTGQLSICMLAERLMTVPTLKIVMVNTDGLEYTVHPDYVQAGVKVCEDWQKITKLQLERARYKRMWVLNVNNYLAEYEE